MSKKLNERDIKFRFIILFILIYFIGFIGYGLEQDPDFFSNTFRKFIFGVEDRIDQYYTNRIEKSIKKELKKVNNVIEDDILNNVELKVLSKNKSKTIYGSNFDASAFYSRRYEDTIDVQATSYLVELYNLKLKFNNKSKYDIYISSRNFNEDNKTGLINIEKNSKLIAKNKSSIVNYTVSSSHNDKNSRFDDIDNCVDGYIKLNPGQSTIKIKFRGEIIELPIKSKIEIFSVGFTDDDVKLQDIRYRLILSVDGEYLKKSLKEKIKNEYNVHSIEYSKSKKEYKLEF